MKLKVLADKTFRINKIYMTNLVNPVQSSKSCLTKLTNAFCLSVLPANAQSQLSKGD